MGGLAGVVGGVLFVFTIIILLALIPPAPTGTSGPIERFPTVRVATVLGETVYLAAVVLWIFLFLALYRALAVRQLAPALFGGGTGLIGLALLAAGGGPAVAFGKLSDLYHAPGATAQDQSTLALVWQGTPGIFNETDTMRFILLVLGFILFGVAMMRAPGFGRGVGSVSVVLGLVGLAGISVFAVDSTAYAPFGILAFVVLPILAGWKVWSVSRSPDLPRLLGRAE
jgi:hypothetical protein